MPEYSPQFIFFGTPDVASETLEILKSHGVMPQLIVTAPDRPVGRHFVMTPSPVKVWADENNIPTLQPEKITPDIVLYLQQKAQELGVDIFIVVAYGKILPQSLIDIPTRGTYNIHYSLLPRHRGASPVEAAILAGDPETGVSIQKMVFKLDAGPVVAESKIAIDANDTTPSLRGKLIPIGAHLLADILPTLASDMPATIQDESAATHCGKTKKEDGLIDPFTDDPIITWRKYRAYQPWPGLYFIEDGKRIKITSARFEHGKFIIERVIPEGKKEMNWS